LSGVVSRRDTRLADQDKGTNCLIGIHEQLEVAQGAAACPAVADLYVSTD